MKKMILLLILLPSITFADNERGNGGDVVVCPNWKSPRMLDYVEYEGLSSYDFNLDSYGADFKSMVEGAFGKLEKYVPLLSQQFMTHAQELTNDISAFQKNVLKRPELAKKRFNKYENTIFTTDELADIQDSDHDSIPKGCSIKQLIIHREPEDSDLKKGSSLIKRYKINSDLILSMNDKNIAAAIIHETLYRYVIEKKYDSDSRKSRSLNFKLSSNYWASLNISKVLQTFKKANFKYITLGSNDKNKIEINLARSTKIEEGLVLSTLDNEQKAISVGGLVNGKLFGKNVWIEAELSDPFVAQRPIEYLRVSSANFTIGSNNKASTIKLGKGMNDLRFSLYAKTTGEIVFTLIDSFSLFTDKEYYRFDNIEWLFGGNANFSGKISPLKFGKCRLRYKPSKAFKNPRYTLYQNEVELINVTARDEDKITQAISDGACGTGLN